MTHNKPIAFNESNMVYSILIVLSLCLDTLSYGLSLGSSLKRVRPRDCIIFSLVSLPLFVAPLLLSKFVTNSWPEKICSIINGLVLFALGVAYLVAYIKNKKENIKNSSNLAPLSENQTSFELDNANNIKIVNVPLKTLFGCLIPVNLDAIFTTFLLGFTFGHVFLMSLIFFVFTFLSIYGGNKIALKLRQNIRGDFSWLSSVLFFALALEKFIDAIIA